MALQTKQEYRYNRLHLGME